MKTFKEFTEATYNGKKVSLGKPFRTPGGPKKSAVYVDPDGDGIYHEEDAVGIDGSDPWCFCLIVNSKGAKCLQEY